MELSDYEIGPEIGRGGQGVVCRGIRRVPATFSYAQKAGCCAPGLNNPDRCRIPDTYIPDTRTAVITNKRFMVATFQTDQPLTAPAETPPTMFLDRIR